MEPRSQAQRSATTQAALLSATIECLIDRGFDGTSTPEICRRAGVSRGAQLHHYPTKASLLVASVEHLCNLRHAEFRALVQQGKTREQRITTAFDQLIRIYTSDTMTAWIELAVASRTDPELAEAMRLVSLRVEEDAEVTLKELFGIADDVPAKSAVRMVLSMLDGLAFRTMLQDKESTREALNVFRALVEPYLGQRD